MIAPAPQSKPTAVEGSQPGRVEVRDYVIRRGGGFYRVGAAGYTQVLSEAGRWTKADAKLYAVNCEGVSIHHVSEFPPDEIATLQARVEELTKALEIARGVIEFEIDVRGPDVGGSLLGALNACDRALAPSLERSGGAT